MADPYQVRVLQQRIDGDAPISTDWVLQGIYKKHSELEKQCYDYFNQDRDLYRLHFHASKHDTCDVHLKPKLWDEGVYFQPNLLHNGVMQVIPHFIKRAVRNGSLMKRVATPIHASVSPPSSPRRAKKTKVTSSSLPDLNASPVIDLTSNDLTIPSSSNFAGAGKDKAGERMEVIEVDSSSNAATAITFHPNSWPPLPPDVNPRQWRIDFDKSKAEVMITRGITDPKRASAWAHIELIKGKYGHIGLEVPTL
ncbi:hypothetical protein NX059_002818 [Plenodomus lindquistii]|nr:hypothetical protein NX059_002818 [Plenodomus lindquistii]